MDKEFVNIPLVDLYLESSEMCTFLEMKSSDAPLEQENWNAVIHSHIDRVLHSTRFLKVENVGIGLDWLNTSRPMCLHHDLKNKVIVLDFFTYCCINCEHARTYLQEVEVKFEKNPELVIIGVHSPKFSNEQALDSVKNAVLRNAIRYPVINDPENSIWNKLGVYCWPTVLILSPDQRVLFSLVGERQIEKLSYICSQTLDYLNASNLTINRNPLPLNLLESNSSRDNLLYPSGISTDGTSIMVSDTGHNRLLLVSYDGKVLDVIGNGEMGCSDGSFTNSSFDRPHGTAWWKTNFIFVADTGNHSIRMIDLESKRVSTIFGAHMLNTEYSDNVDQNFASPWDVCLGPELGSNLPELNVLYIAVAGSHQIWAMKLEESILLSRQYSSLKCIPFAGNGKEECRNNTYKMKAGFAQPSGICYSKLYPGSLFVADSESSSIRSLSLIDGSVKTVVGGALDPKDLFQYGDEDGVGCNVKLQHPIGICVLEDGEIFITDTYNHKVKLIDSKTKSCSTIAGRETGRPNCKESLLKFQFDEPSGICYSSDRKHFVIVDTNNHTLKTFDPEMNITENLSLKFAMLSCVDAPQNSTTLEHKVFCQDDKSTKISLAFGGQINCSFKFLDSGISLTSGSIVPWDLSLKGDCNWKVSSLSNALFDPSIQPSLILKCIDDNTKMPHAEVTISAELSVCDDINMICLPKKFSAQLLIEFSGTGSNSYDIVFLL